jgi:hypothetical protein
MGARFARNLNFNPRESGGMRRSGKLDSLAEFHLIAEYPGNYDRFQIFEPYVGRPSSHPDTVGIQVGLFEHVLIRSRECIVPATGYEFKVKFHIFPNTFDVMVVSPFRSVEVRVCLLIGCLTRCSFVRDPIHRIRWSEHHINSSAVRFPPRNLLSILFVGENDAAVVLCFKVVVSRGGIGHAAIPKLLSETLPLLVGI